MWNLSSFIALACIYLIASWRLFIIKLTNISILLTIRWESAKSLLPVPEPLKKSLIKTRPRINRENTFPMFSGMEKFSENVFLYERAEHLIKIRDVGDNEINDAS